MECIVSDAERARLHGRQRLEQHPHVPASSPVAGVSFVGIVALALIASAAATVWSCRSMAAMGEMPMPGGWTMSTVWVPTCGQTWLGAAGAFVRMWTLMMAAMILPSSALELRQFWRVAPPVRCFALARNVLLTGAAYLLAWAVVGAIVFVIGNALAVNLPRAAQLARLGPLASGVVVVIAGAVEFASWKARRIACCASALSRDGFLRNEALGACKHGLGLALHGGCCCANLMAVLLVIGVMDLRAMAAITAAMIIERMTPASRWAVRGIGLAVVAAGLGMIAHAMGL